jgi:1-acyl-sn-glycerol-3-phosphate acyltransferase
LLRILRSLRIWSASAFLIVSWMPLVALVRLFDRGPLRLRTARFFRRLGPALAVVNPWRLHITGRDFIQNGETYVVVSNHQSLADIPLVAHIGLDAKWLAKAELFRIPVVGWMMSMSGDVAVERGDRRKAGHALLQCARYLRQRCSVVFFPEGTRSRTGDVLPFNDGPFQLAIREKVRVLPVAVEGTGSALPRTTWLFGPVQDIYLSVLEPVSSEGRQVAELRENVRSRIAAEVTRLRSSTLPTPVS